MLIFNESSIRGSINKASALYEHHINGVPLPKLIKNLEFKSNSGEKKRINHRLFKLETEFAEIQKRLKILEAREVDNQSSLSNSNFVKKIAKKLSINNEIGEELLSNNDKSNLESQVVGYDDTYQKYRKNLFEHF